MNPNDETNGASAAIPDDLAAVLDAALSRSRSKLFDQIKFEQLTSDRLADGNDRGGYDRAAYDKAGGHDKSVG